MDTLSGRIGKVVASHAEVARSIPDRAETAQIYTMHGALNCDQSIGSTISDAIVVAGGGRLQLGVPHWATSVDYSK